MPKPYVLNADESAFLARCALGGVRQEAWLPDLVGLDEAEVPDAAPWSSSIRVIGRDGEMLGYDWNLDVERINLIIGGSRVLWAARF